MLILRKFFTWLPKRVPLASRQLQLDALEDRWVPAVTASVSAGVLTVSLNAPNDQVYLEVDGSGGTDVGSISGLNDVYNGSDTITRIVIKDADAFIGQSVTFGGSNAFTLPNGLEISGVESATFNQAVNAGSGSNAISVIASSAISINATLATAGGGISLSANNGIAINNALISDGGNIVLQADADGNGAGALTLSAAVMGGWTQQAQLNRTGGVAYGEFGSSVALSADGTTAIVGGFFDNGPRGTATVFARSGGVWIQQAQLTSAATGGRAGGHFGYSVGLSSDGNTAVVGAHRDGVGPNTIEGTATVFVRTGATWSQQQQLSAADGSDWDYFGYSVAISGDGKTVIVGAHYDDVGTNTDQGSASVFTLLGGAWTQQAHLTGTGGEVNNYFGYSVALSGDGDTAIVGAPFDFVGANKYQGSATVFTRSNGVWNEQKQLTSATGMYDDTFGISVAISTDGNTAIVGAYYDNVGARPDQGSATVFARSGVVWTEQAQLTMATGSTSDCFGVSVALSGDGNIAIVGAHLDDVGAPDDSQGTATLFTRLGGVWTEKPHLPAVGGAAGDYFGWSVALSSDGSTAMVGAKRDDTGANINEGSAYAFTVASVSPGGSITAGTGMVSISAADVDLQSAIFSTATVELTVAQADRAIDLGTNTSGTFGLTAAELNKVTAGSIRIGSTVAGTITISQALAPSGTSTVSLTSRANIIGACDITTTNLFLTSAGYESNLSGIIGGGTLSYNGPGILALSGVNSYNGSTIVSGGTLLVNGTNKGLGAITVTGGTLGGTGSITGAVNINQGGTINPGNGGNHVGTLTVGELTFNGGSYAADFSGNTSDTITSTGSINLNAGKTGNFIVNSQSGIPSVNNTFKLINKTGNGAISNTPLFGAAQGATVTMHSIKAIASYIGGDGNDFTLTLNSPPTALVLSTASIDENSSANSAVGLFTTTDPDANNQFTYSLVPGAGSTDNNLFTISDNQLLANASFDFEECSSYSVRVRTTDHGGLFFDQPILVTVTDVNEAPATLSWPTSTIVENAGSNAVVVMFTTSDPDAGNTFIYTLVPGFGDANNGQFEIIAGQLFATTSLDFESGATRTVRVRTTDQGGLTLEQTLLITVTDVNEVPTAEMLSASTIAENAGINAVVGLLTTTDPDAGNTFTYTLVSGNGDTNNSLFNINDKQLRANNSFNFELDSSYTVRVRTTDQGGLSFEQAVTISVTNINEPPTISSPAVVSIAENSVGTFLAVAGSDPDAGAVLVWSLSGGIDAALFSINSSTGSLKFNNIPDFEVPKDANGDNMYEVMVRLSDGSLQVTQAITVSVSNVVDGPSIKAPLAASVVVNFSTSISGLSVVDPLAGVARLTTTLSAATGRLTLSTRTGLVFLTGDGVSDATIKFTGTLAQTNAALKTATFITATDTASASTLNISTQRGTLVSRAVVSLPLDVAGRVVRVVDQAIPGKLSIMVQGTETADTLLVSAVGGSMSSYTVTLNGTSTTFTGITGRIIAFGLGGNDYMDLSGAWVAEHVDGGEGNDVVLGGRLADRLFGGNGADLIAGGLGEDIINGGAGNDIVIDGTVLVKTAGKTLRTILNSWALLPSVADSNYVAFSADLLYTADKASKDALTGGLGTDWFWSATVSTVADVTDKLAAERRRLV